MNLYIYENHCARDLDPISLTRPVFDVRTGAFTFLERIMQSIPEATLTLFVREELGDICRESWPGFQVNPARVEEGIWLLGNVLWTKADLKKIVDGSYGFYYAKGMLAGAKLPGEVGHAWLKMGGPVLGDLTASYPTDEVESPLCRHLWNILENIPNSLADDATKFTLGNRVGGELTGVHLLESENVYVAESATVQPGVVMDASQGPVIIDEKVRIRAQVYLEGPVYIGRESLIKAQAQIKNSVIGPVCKVGGEVDTSIIQGYSNKTHAGHLGDAYLGQWVNLGAGTTNSNLKNNYGDVKVHVDGKAVNTGKAHVGCFIGDHTKTAIGTILNTGTVIGPGCMLVSAGFPPKTMRPFTWYVAGKHKVVRWSKFLETAEIVKERRGLDMSPGEKVLLKKVYEER